VEVEIEPAVYQSNSCGGVPQELFLFGAQEEIVNLVGKRVMRIVFEKSLEGTFRVLLICRCKWVHTTQCLYERGFSNTARADDGNEFVHIWNYKIVQQFNCAAPLYRCRPIESGLLAECRRVEEFHCCDKPAAIQLLNGEGLWQ